MAIDVFSISLSGSDVEIEGGNYVSQKNDTQYVTLTDGGTINTVEIEKFGRGNAREPGEGPGGDDEFYLDLSGFNDDFSIEIKSFDPGDTFFFSGALSSSNVGNVYTINYIGSDAQVHQVVIDLESTNKTGVAGISITCFAAGTLIETSEGLTAAEDLAVGDEVLCGDGQIRPVRWISRRHVGAAELARNPEFRPVRIRKGAFTDVSPYADLVVSQQHKVLIDDWRAELMFGEERVFVPAVHLINDNDILRDHAAEEVTYYHFMFDCHQTVFSNGLETESFFPGAGAIDCVSQAGKEELFRLFPALKNSAEAYGPTCYATLKAHEAHALLGA